MGWKFQFRAKPGAHGRHGWRSLPCASHSRPCPMNIMYSKRVIRIDWDMKIIQNRRKFGLRQEKCIGLGQFDKKICSEYAEFAVVSEATARSFRMRQSKKILSTIAFYTGTNYEAGAQSVGSPNYLPPNKRSFLCTNPLLHICSRP